MPNMWLPPLVSLRHHYGVTVTLLSREIKLFNAEASLVVEAVVHTLNDQLCRKCAEVTVAANTPRLAGLETPLWSPKLANDSHPYLGPMSFLPLGISFCRKTRVDQVDGAWPGPI